MQIYQKMSINVMHCAILYHLYNLKNVKNTHGGVLLLVKLQAEACNFTKINTPPWVFLTFFKLFKWYQITQRILNVSRTNGRNVQQRKAHKINKKIVERLPTDKTNPTVFWNFIFAGVFPPYIRSTFFYQTFNNLFFNLLRLLLTLNSF